MNSKIFLIFFICPFTFIMNTPIELSFTAPFTVTALATKTTFFITDTAFNEFVLKYHPRGPKRAIHDTLGAYVGKSIHININAVEIFSPHHPFNSLFNEINPLLPMHIGVTTLHSRALGAPVKKIKKMDATISIKRGLCNEKNLKSITKHMMLCDIVALDLFTDNPDRHNGNLLFDKKTQQFYAIDMDHSFQSAYALVTTPYDYDFDTLATRAYDFLKTLEKKQLSSQEIKTLKRLKQTLHILASCNPPAILFAEWMNIAEKADYTYSQREQEKIKKYLEHNALQVNQLLMQLNAIIVMHS